ncbi:MAG: plasmid recombination protein [Oscillospiraceae bacterium]|nr:plasmid recombination protein [Oscillospiraceae bacterium]
MSLKKTISHVQGKGCISHNNRAFIPKNVDPLRTKENITYVSMEIGSAYDFLFSKPVEEYNSKQKRSDRKINVSYFEHLFNRTPCNTVIESANGQKSFYEDVVQIGTKDDTGIGSSDAETAKLCLDEYMKGFQQRNPYFYVFNSVLHMDEATPHLHIDYIPFGHYSRGISVQNGIAQALAEMGFGTTRVCLILLKEHIYA